MELRKIRDSVIYKIGSLIKSERCYIGSAVSYNRRKNLHLCELRANKHHSKILQNHFNKYGENDLVFTIIEYCSPNMLIEREQFYLDTTNPYFNVCKTAGSCFGVRYKRSKEVCLRMGLSKMGNKNLLGFKFSEESKEKMRKSHLGVKHSQETRDKMSKAMKGIKKPPFTKEHKRKIGIESKNRIRKKGMHWKLSEETRKRIADAQRALWALRKLNKTKAA